MIRAVAHWKKSKKITVAVLATGLLASTSIQVLANDTEKVNASNFETVNLQYAPNNVKNESTSIDDLQLIVANFPSVLLTNYIAENSKRVKQHNK